MSSITVCEIVVCRSNDILKNIVGSSTTYRDRSTTHPKFDPTEVQTHDLQIMTIHFMSLRRLL